MWLMIERKDPKTGKTTIEEFVERFVTHNRDLAKKSFRNDEGH